MSPQKTFMVQFQALPQGNGEGPFWRKFTAGKTNQNAYRQLARWIKAKLRRHGLKCLTYRELPVKGNLTPVSTR